MAADASRRNRNFKVTRPGGAGYFVKQAKAEDPLMGAEATATLRREGFLYGLAHSDARFAALAPLLPPFHGYDPACNALVSGLIADSEDAGLLQRRTGTFPIELAAALGQALASFHRGVTVHSPATPSAFPQQPAPGSLQPPSVESIFPGRVPWTLAFHEMRIEQLQAPSGGIVQLHLTIGQHPEFGSSLVALQREWHVNAFTHGDMKWENCLVSRRSEEAQPRITIVDWELADFGDACWDAAAILQAYLAAWITSMPLEAGSVEWMIERAAYPLSALQPSMQVFWRTYVEAMGLEPSTAIRWLDRATGYAAVRLMQTAYESLQYSPQMTPLGLCLLQVSLNMLTQPRKAVGTLMGM
jgi:hypothetical protein